MKKFTCVQDIGDLKSALAEAFEIKKDRFKYVELGRNKTLMMIFFNSSLRTRLSTQKAAINLGMNVMVLDINQGAWKLETERGVIMDGDKPEHIEYYEMTLAYLSEGGYIIADNTLWDGHVLEQPRNTDAQTIGIKAFNDLVAQDVRVEKVILPLRDGLTIIRKKIISSKL